MAVHYSIIPESAPFSDEQRAWLNGFLAGWIGLPGSGNGAAGGTAAFADSVVTALLAGSPAAPSATPAAEEEDFPWHDSALPLDDRLRLAEGRPLPRRLMAAMAQLNCGSCGYDCRRYAEAIAAGEEKSLKLCSPGGKETAKRLKELVSLDVGAASTNGHSTNGHAVTNGHATNGHLATNGHAAANGTPLKKSPAEGSSPASSKAPAPSRWSRTNPFPAKVLAIRNLNGEGSAKQTSHVELCLAEGDLSYEVGDALGVYPTNCKVLVQAILERLRATGDEAVEFDGRPMPLSQVLLERVCLTEIGDELLERLADGCGDATEAARIRSYYLDDSEPIEGWDVLELLNHCPSVTLTAADLISNLSPLRPRLYSISSSLKAHAEQVHLTVGRVAWSFRDRGRKGVASTMFSDRLKRGDTVRVFVHKAHGFSVPTDSGRPMIMIGPGTGIAPFRAFLQERRATAAPGKNWLFFGDQQSATDFLYRDELHELQQTGVLTRLDSAFSRDQVEKIYVQNRMLEHGAALWQWLDEGGHVYVCGDAKRMAVDVDRALRQIVAEHGGMSAADADAYVARMVSEKRYCRDVY